MLVTVTLLHRNFAADNQDDKRDGNDDYGCITSRPHYIGPGHMCTSKKDDVNSERNVCAMADQSYSKKGDATSGEKSCTTPVNNTNLGLLTCSTHV